MGSCGVEWLTLVALADQFGPHGFNYPFFGAINRSYYYYEVGHQDYDLRVVYTCQMPECRIDNNRGSWGPQLKFGEMNLRMSRMGLTIAASIKGHHTEIFASIVPS